MMTHADGAGFAEACAQALHVIGGASQAVSGEGDRERRRRVELRIILPEGCRMRRNLDIRRPRLNVPRGRGACKQCLLPERFCFLYYYLHKIARILVRGLNP